MKKSFSLSTILKLCILFCCMYSCAKGTQEPDPIKKQEEEPPLTIPAGEVTVACYYFPNWGPVAQSEWNTVKFAQPKFAGHQQPKVPVWGYENENEPAVMARKIEEAAANGIDAFIFDWYYTDEGTYLEKALEQGFMGAANNSRIKFAIMWANHDVGERKGVVKPQTFEQITDYLIEKYFKHPSYWKVDGCPYFSIYQFDTFLETYGNNTLTANAALQRFRDKVKAAGFPDLHLNGVLWGLKGRSRNQIIEQLGVNSTTSYVWIHHNALPSFPTSDYNQASNQYFNTVNNGGAANGLETPAHTIPVPYHPNVTMGWDASPRCGNITAQAWMAQQAPYPFGPVLVNNSPYNFKKALIKAKEYCLNKPEKSRIVVLNAWNEWGEGSYLEPDQVNGTKYLEAVKAVFN